MLYIMNCMSMKRLNSTNSNGEKSVLFISNVPSPYNVEYLNELGKLIRVTAVFERASSGERDKSWKKLNIKHFECIILKGIKAKVDSAISFGSFKYIKRYKDSQIIIGNPSTPTGILSIFYCKIHKIPFILQSEGGFAGTGKGLKERFKKFLMKNARMYLSGMTKNEYFLTYGGTKNTVKSYPFTSLYKSDIIESLPTVEEKSAIKRKYNISYEKLIIFVGQFIHRKGIDILLKACIGLDKSVGVLIIGGDCTEEYRQIIKEHNINNIEFINFLNKGTLKQYYLASDVFVLPTREDTWGLVVNEAMSAGLPIITTNRCVAGVELIENNVNGFLVEVEDIYGLRQKIEKLLLDKSLCNYMAKNNLEKIKYYTYENMAQVIYNHLES